MKLSNNDLPHIGDDDVYVDKNKIAWTSSSVGARKICGVDPKTIFDRLPKNTPTIQGIARNNKETTFYILSEIQHAISDIYDEPTADKEGFFIDEQNQIWTSYQKAAEILKVDPDTIIKNLPKETPTRLVREQNQQGKDTHKPLEFHLLSDMQFLVSNLASIEIETDFNQFHTTVDNDTGETLRFGTLRQIARTFNARDGLIEDIKDKVRKVEARVDGKYFTLYCLEDFEKTEKIRRRTSIEIRVNKNGIYIDKNGSTWYTVPGFYTALSDDKKSQHSISSIFYRAKKLEHRNAIGSNGHANGVKIYKKEDLETIV